MTAHRMRLGAGGAVGRYQGDPIGSATREHTTGSRLGSAALLGALGVAAPSVAKAFVNAPDSVLAANREGNDNAMRQLISLHNTGLLSPLSLGKKILGDVGGLASAGTENAVSNALL